VDWIGLGQVESSCECGNEPSGSIKCWETIERFANKMELQKNIRNDFKGFISLYIIIVSKRITHSCDRFIRLEHKSQSLQALKNLPQRRQALPLLFIQKSNQKRTARVMQSVFIKNSNSYTVYILL
jgi:hypothetical protein